MNALGISPPLHSTYTLATADVANLPAGFEVYLRDATTSQTVKLSQGSYSFAVTVFPRRLRQRRKPPAPLDARKRKNAPPGTTGRSIFALASAGRD